MEAVIEVERVERVERVEHEEHPPREITPYELERGKPMPDAKHAAVQMTLGAELVVRYRQQYRVYSELSLDTQPKGATPDLAIYPMAAVDFQATVPARRADPPLCCIEIQSNSRSTDEMVEKVKLYFAFGVKSCWIVQPLLEGIFVFDQPTHYEFYHGDDTLRDEVLGMELPVAAAFA